MHETVLGRNMYSISNLNWRKNHQYKNELHTTKKTRQFPYKSKLSSVQFFVIQIHNFHPHSKKTSLCIVWATWWGGESIRNYPELERKREEGSESEERCEVTRSDKTKLMKSLAEYQERVSSNMMFHYEKCCKHRNTTPWIV